MFHIIALGTIFVHKDEIMIISIRHNNYIIVAFRHKLSNIDTFVYCRYIFMTNWTCRYNLVTYTVQCFIKWFVTISIFGNLAMKLVRW